MTRAQHLKSSWQFDHAKNKYTGFDGVEHWTVEQDISSGRWFAAHGGILLRVTVRQGFHERQRMRTFGSANGALNAAEREAATLHLAQIAERRRP